MLKTETRVTNHELTWVGTETKPTPNLDLFGNDFSFADDNYNEDEQEYVTNTTSGKWVPLVILQPIKDWEQTLQFIQHCCKIPLATHTTLLFTILIATRPLTGAERNYLYVMIPNVITKVAEYENATFSRQS